MAAATSLVVRVAADDDDVGGVGGGDGSLRGVPPSGAPGFGRTLVRERCGPALPSFAGVAAADIVCATSIAEWRLSSDNDVVD